MKKWEYATAPVLVHATQQILNTWGEDGWELVTIIPGPNPENLVAYSLRWHISRQWFSHLWQCNAEFCQAIFDVGSHA